jgi:hypothetical protein
MRKLIAFDDDTFNKAETAGARPDGDIPGTSGVDLTFATRLATNSESECQIPNSTRNLYLLVVL